MPADPKTAPFHAPPDPNRIAAGLRAAFADPKTHPQAYIRLTASGGVRGEAYDFEYRIDASGKTSVHLRDEMKGVRLTEPAPDAKKVTAAQFASLAAALDIDALMRSETPSGKFPPDSVVGRLEIGNGADKAIFLFLADEEQAKQARIAVPDPLRKAVDALYRAAATQLQIESVRP